MEDNWIGWVIVAVGVWAIIEGIRSRLGVSRSWFYMHTTPAVMMPTIVFGSIPIGLGVLLMGAMWLLRGYGWISEQTAWFMLGLMGLCMVLGAVLWVLKPRFIQPKWYRWLWKHHGAIMPELKKDAERLGETWVERTRTQAGLEQWALEVRHKL